MNKYLAGILAAMLSAVFECWGATHYVVMPGAAVTPADPYTSWATAGTSIIDVVNAAATNAAPRTILVADGVYYPTNRITVPSGIAMTICSVSGYTNTILNGSNAGTNGCLMIYDISAGVSHSKNHFIGFTITNYSTLGNGQGTLHVRQTTVRNCLISGNDVSRSPGVSGVQYGTGGGIYTPGYSVISNCVIRGNRAALYGSGIFMYIDGRTIVADCLIEHNSAMNDTTGYGYGAGVYISGPFCIVSNCCILNNANRQKSSGYHSYSGGGIYVGGRGTNLVVADCVITGNQTYGNGGGIYSGYIAGSTTMVENCVVAMNMATNNGGGLYGYNFELRNCLVGDNTAWTNNGGGICCWTSIIESCTIAGNAAGISGGGVYVADADAVFSARNNIIYSNTAPEAANFTNSAGNAGFEYSCVTPAVAGVGNIAGNPAFANMDGGNYRLTAWSPCFNAGINQAWMEGAFDLDGKIRVLYDSVDMGCYEYRLPPTGTIMIVR